MRIIVSGASGLIGSRAVLRFAEAGHEVIALSRNPEIAKMKAGNNNIVFSKWPEPDGNIWQEWFSKPCVIINLAGANIAEGRWTSARKELLTKSRIDTVKKIADAIKLSEKKPLLLLQASASGYYGSRPGEVLTENSEKGRGFLADLTELWENAASPLKAENVRTVFLRTSVVLANEGGALPKMILPLKLFAGAWPGNGKQYVSWIHIDDWLKAVEFIIESEEIEGEINLSSPEPLMMKELLKTAGKILKRPVWAGIPTFLLKAIFGEMAEETLISDQRIIPEKLTDAGFVFDYIKVNEALNKLL